MKRLIGITLMAAVLATSTAFACDDRSGDGCVATAPPEAGNPAFQGDGAWDAFALGGGVLAWLGFMWGAVRLVELEVPPAF